MAKQKRPSFSFAPPAAKTPRDTAWVYRTDGEEPPDAAELPEGLERVEETHVSPMLDTPNMPVAATAPAAGTRSDRYEPARAVVRRYAAGSAVVSLVPVPFLDLAGVAVVVGAMVRAIAKVYGVPFEKAAATAAISAVAGGAGSGWLGRRLGRAVLRAIPGAGAVAAVALPAAAGASTYAIGRIFIAHFESGGSLKDLHADAAARHARTLEAA